VKEPPTPAAITLALSDASAAVNVGHDAGPPSEPVASVEPSPPLAPEPEAAARSAHETLEADPRFTVRWGSEGLCTPDEARQRRAMREALLATFLLEPWPHGTILRSPNIRPEVVEMVKQSLERGRSISSSLLSWQVAPSHPTTLVYESLEQMREVSCVNRSAIGYYDGSIHLSGNWGHRLFQIRDTIVHEYMHHVLLGAGVRLPMWLQEGLAMSAASEDWWLDSSLGLEKWLLDSHLPFAAMVPAFPHTADEKFAGAAYYQSYMMTLFVYERGDTRAYATLVNALAQQQVTPHEAFHFATGLCDDALEAEWRAFLERQHAQRHPPLRR
jgi:hypothetical protein